MGTIVCGVDDSPEAKEALRVATQLSADAGLRLVAVHVEDSIGAGPDLRGSAEQRGRQLLDRLLSGRELNGGTDRRVEVGNPVTELARVASEEAASMIVLGSRGRRWWRGRPSSRLTADLTAAAACPVLVVPPAAPR